MIFRQGHSTTASAPTSITAHMLQEHKSQWSYILGIVSNHTFTYMNIMLLHMLEMRFFVSAFSTIYFLWIVVCVVHSSVQKCWNMFLTAAAPDLRHLLAAWIIYRYGSKGNV